MRKPTSTLTQNRLKELLHYEPATGVFTWIKVTTNRVAVGDKAGQLMKRGYISIGLDNFRTTAHRLAWFYSYGVWPTMDIDHIDRNKTNNAIANLREVNAAENQHNSSDKKNNKSGVRGVSWDKNHNKWIAKICLHRKQIYLGLFDDLSEASAAYQSAKTKLHPAYVRSNKDSR